MPARHHPLPLQSFRQEAQEQAERQGEREWQRSPSLGANDVDWEVGWGVGQAPWLTRDAAWQQVASCPRCVTLSLIPLPRRPLWPLLTTAAGTLPLVPTLQRRLRDNLSGGEEEEEEDPWGA